MPQIWISYTDDEGEEGSARWGDVTCEQIDYLLGYVVAHLGRQPDTLT